jgi:beta-N-acetylhexosaminidase
MTACGRTQRRLVLGLAALVLALAACTAPGAAPPPGDAVPTPAAGPSTPTTPTATPSAAPSATCAELVDRLSLDERVGQLLMVAVTSTGLTAEQRAAVRDTAAGSVVLLGNSTAGVRRVRDVVARVRAASVRPEGVETLLAADQEGGLVQRLQGPGFDTIPSAVRQAALSDTELGRRAETWGEQLAAAGIDADLAPVADVVPQDLVRVNQPVGQLRRGYGSDPDVVADKVAAFTSGMDDAGVATAVKHFPGLGRVRGNTDTTRDVVDETTTRDDAALRGFRAAVRAGVDMVMVSSATYARIDGRRRAVFSPVVVDGMIRDDLDFDGVVISDDLAAVALQDVPAGQRVVRFVQAGGDLAIVGSAAEARTMARALRVRAERDADFAAQVDRAAVRVLRLKQRRGLADC